MKFRNFEKVEKVIVIKTVIITPVHKNMLTYLKNYRRTIKHGSFFILFFIYTLSLLRVASPGGNIFNCFVLLATITILNVSFWIISFTISVSYVCQQWYEYLTTFIPFLPPFRLAVR